MDPMLVLPGPDRSDRALGGVCVKIEDALEGLLGFDPPALLVFIAFLGGILAWWDSYSRWCWVWCRKTRREKRVCAGAVGGAKTVQMLWRL